VIAEINEQMPRTHGNNVVPFDRIHAFIATDRPLVEHHPEPETAVEARIGELVADARRGWLDAPDGHRRHPDAVLARLGGHRDLGVHTEMFSDGLVDLVEAGVITNTRKKVHARAHRHSRSSRGPSGSSTSSTTTRWSSFTRAIAPTTRR
jgi:4-hydroxybutyrate CoA-transferase